MTLNHELILASASPRRQALLQDWQIPYQVIVPEVDETFSLSRSPAEEALHLAREKAEWVRDQHQPDRPILAADTIVALGALKLGKPEDDADALRILMSLSGQDLVVISGVALAECGRPTLSAWAETRLTMRPYDLEEARTYVASGEPMGKAGAFAIQGLGGALIAQRAGSYSNVVGLARNVVFQLLEARQSAMRGL